jgi:PAS domain S-box-containing protein
MVIGSHTKHLLGLLCILAVLIAALEYVGQHHDQLLSHTLGTMAQEQWVYHFALVGVLSAIILVLVRCQYQQQVSALREREHALCEAEEKYRTLVEYASDAILILRQGDIVYCNPAFLTLLGYASTADIAQRFLDVVVPTDQYRVAAHLQAQYQTRETPEPYEVELVTQTEQRVTVEVKPCAIQYQRRAAMMVVLRDITERNRAAAALAQRATELARSNADLELFAYVASHDLQEPLRKVMSFTELLTVHLHGQLDTDAETYLAYITDAASRMRGLLRDLLAYGRIGKVERPPVPTDITVLLEETLSTFDLTIRELNAEVIYQALPTVICHPSLIGQLLQNLIGNALKFHGAEPPCLHVSAERRNDLWCFAVRDNGIGIEPQYAKQIFVIFQRLHARAAYPGAGLGLAICHKIVEHHGGHIWVDSKLGEGATFYFTLPVTPHSPPH